MLCYILKTLELESFPVAFMHRIGASHSLFFLMLFSTSHDVQ